MLAHFNHHLITTLPVPLLPFIREYFSLNYTQAGLVVSAFTLSYGIAQLPGGWLADRLGPRVMITISLSGLAVIGFLIGITRSYVALTTLLILLGFTGGGYHPSAPPLIAKLVHPSTRGRAIGLHMASGSASYFLAPLIGATIAASLGWHNSFIV
ncbi:MAG: MFS transporter, partial [Deltaproteobacteria bacterium]|nr:MFS transporter [Deltaproteobacteria bacterium]